LRSHFSGTVPVTCTLPTKFNHLINQLTYLPQYPKRRHDLRSRSLKNRFSFYLITNEWHPPADLAKFNSLTLFLLKEEGEDSSMNFHGLHSHQTQLHMQKQKVCIIIPRHFAVTVRYTFKSLLQFQEPRCKPQAYLHSPLKKGRCWKIALLVE